MTITIEHRQVPFTTLHGETVDVDEGMLEVLVELRRLGVETQYSCQGDDQSAYVLGTSKTLTPLVRRILHDADNARLYSPMSRYTILKFKQGYIEFEFACYTRPKGEYERLRTKVKKGKSINQGYAYERSYSRFYGSRTTLRWPEKMTPVILRLLQETKTSR